MTFDPRKASLDELRKMMGEVIDHNPNSGRFWDLITCLRGPDSPSERGDMSPSEASAAYAGRRKRKRETVEVIREKAFFGSVGGAARHHDADYVLLPPQKEWDHFDKHVDRAARAIGLEVRIKGEDEVGDKKWEVECKVVEKPAYSPQYPSTIFDPDGMYKLAYIEQKIAQFTEKLAVVEEQYNKEPSGQLKNAIAYYKNVVSNYEVKKAKKLASSVQIKDEQAPAPSIDLVEALAKQQSKIQESLDAPTVFFSSSYPGLKK